MDGQIVSLDTALRNAEFKTKLLDIVATNDVLKALAELVLSGLGFPCAGSMLDVLRGTIVGMQQEKVQCLFEAIKENPEKLKTALLESDEFVHKFMITYKAVMTTYQKEKIRVFARLLTGSIGRETESGVDLFEEYLGIIEEMSYREMQVLFLIDEYYTKYLPLIPELAEEGADMDVVLSPQSLEAKKEKAFNMFRNELQNDLADKLQIPLDEQKDYLIRLSRTRLYEQIDYIYGETGDGILTTLYYKLKDLLANGERSESGMRC